MRLQVTVWVFQKRKWTWLETIIITVLMSFVLYAFAKAGGNKKQVVGVVEVIGILLYSQAPISILILNIPGMFGN